MVGISLLFIFNTYSYLDSYFIHGPYEFAKSFQFGYKQMVKSVLQREDNYDRVIITTQYDQPYIYFLFYGRVDPVVKNNGYFAQAFDKYKFENYSQDLLEESRRLNTRDLFVLGSKDDLKGLRVLDTIKFPDGSIAFTIATKL